MWNSLESCRSVLLEESFPLINIYKTTRSNETELNDKSSDKLTGREIGTELPSLLLGIFKLAETSLNL